MHFHWILLHFTSVFLFLLDVVQCEITLGTCCPFQHEFLNGSCSTISKNFTHENVFKNFIQIPDHLLTLKYRNLSAPTRFGLKPQPVSCTNGSFNLVLPLKNTDNKLDAEKPVAFFPTTGILKYGQDNFYPDEYCFNSVREETLELIVCNAECSEKKPCVTKCCDLDEVWDVSLLLADGPVRCRPSGEKRWTPKIYSSVYSREADLELTNKPHIITSHPRNWCAEGEPILHSLTSRPAFPKKELFKIMEDGNVWLKIDRRDWSPLASGAYCIDGAQNFPDENASSFYSGNFDIDTIVLDCSPPNYNTCEEREQTNLYAISLVVASVFLLLTVTVYILLWEKQNIHGWTSLVYFASLFFMYIFTALAEFSLGFQAGEEGSSWGCYLIGVMAHFFWLSSFCWMSALNFDLWWTFRALLPTGSKSKGLKRFLMYVLFSVGIPLGIVGTAISLDYLYGDDVESNIITADYGKRVCFVDKKLALLPYIYGPIGVLLSCNVIFFSVTVFDMYKIQQSTKFAAKSSSKNSQQRQSLVLFAKLFLLMGIPWAFEVISWWTTPCDDQVPWYWQVMDMINIFQAVAIFLTFVCKSETRNSLESKFPSFKRFMSWISITPSKAQSIVERHPALKFLIRPFTRSAKNPRAFSSGKTLSTFAESSKTSNHIVEQKVMI